MTDIIVSVSSYVTPHGQNPTEQYIKFIFKLFWPIWATVKARHYSKSKNVEGWQKCLCDSSVYSDTENAIRGYKTVCSKTFLKMC